MNFDFLPSFLSISLRLLCAFCVFVGVKSSVVLAVLPRLLTAVKGKNSEERRAELTSRIHLMRYSSTFALFVRSTIDEISRKLEIRFGMESRTILRRHFSAALCSRVESGFVVAFLRLGGRWRPSALAEDSTAF